MMTRIQNFCIAMGMVILSGLTTTKISAQTWCPLGNSIDISGNVLTSHLTMDAYQWVKCPVDIPGATGKSYVVLLDGDYMLRMLLGSCWDTVACITVTTTSIREIQQAPDLVIYPNPCRQNTINVSSRLLNGAVHMQVRDVLGRVQSEQMLRFEQYRTSFNLDLGKGYYILIFRDEEGRTAQSGILMEKSTGNL